MLHWHVHYVFCQAVIFLCYGPRFFSSPPSYNPPNPDCPCPFARSVEWDYYLTPNSVQGYCRWAVEIFYPLVLLAFALQLTTWIDLDLSFRAHDAKKKSTEKLALLLKIALLAFDGILLVLASALVGVNVSNSPSQEPFGLAYRIMLALYIVALLVVAIVFATRILLVVRTLKSQSATASRRKVALFTLLTCGVLLVRGDWTFPHVFHAHFFF